MPESLVHVKKLSVGNNEMRVSGEAAFREFGKKTSRVDRPAMTSGAAERGQKDLDRANINRAQCRRRRQWTEGASSYVPDKTFDRRSAVDRR